MEQNFQEVQNVTNQKQDFLSELKALPYYYEFTREDSQRLLNQQKNPSYLLRPSSKKDCITLDVCSNGQIKSFPIALKQIRDIPQDHTVTNMQQLKNFINKAKGVAQPLNDPNKMPAIIEEKQSQPVNIKFALQDAPAGSRLYFAPVLIKDINPEQFFQNLPNFIVANRSGNSTFGITNAFVKDPSDAYHFIQSFTHMKPGDLLGIIECYVDDSQLEEPKSFKQRRPDLVTESLVKEIKNNIPYRRLKSSAKLNHIVISRVYFLLQERDLAFVIHAVKGEKIIEIPTSLSLQTNNLIELFKNNLARVNLIVEEDMFKNWLTKDLLDQYSPQKCIAEMKSMVIDNLTQAEQSNLLAWEHIGSQITQNALNKNLYSLSDLLNIPKTNIESIFILAGGKYEQKRYLYFFNNSEIVLLGEHTLKDQMNEEEVLRIAENIDAQIISRIKQMQVAIDTTVTTNSNPANSAASFGSPLYASNAAHSAQPQNNQGKEQERRSAFDDSPCTIS